jgi:hypothetical protein
MDSTDAPRKRSTRQADREAMRIAARQWGAIARWEALEAGMTSHQIAHRLETGQWRRVARGVYVVAGAPNRFELQVMIACLAGPASAAASHLTAAALFGLAKF